jgi:hypothetical protein
MGQSLSALAADNETISTEALKGLLEGVAFEQKANGGCGKNQSTGLCDNHCTDTDIKNNDCDGYEAFKNIIQKMQLQQKLDTSNLATRTELDSGLASKADTSSLGAEILNQIGSDYVSFATLQDELGNYSKKPNSKTPIQDFIVKLEANLELKAKKSAIDSTNKELGILDTKVGKIGTDACKAVTCVPSVGEDGVNYDLDDFFITGPGKDIISARLKLESDTLPNNSEFMQSVAKQVPSHIDNEIINDILDTKASTTGKFATGITSNMDLTEAFTNIDAGQADAIFNNVTKTNFNTFIGEYIDTTLAEHHLNKATSVVAIPPGTIVAHSGSEAPNSGWVICDGVALGPDKNKTPDLRGRFIVGAGDAPTGNTLENNKDADQNFIHSDRLDTIGNFAWANQGNYGGAAKNLLTSDNVPEHRHHEFVTNWETPHPHGVRNKNLTGNEFVSGRGWHDGMIHTEYWMSGTGMETFSKQEPADGLSGKPTNLDGNLITTTPHNNLPPYYSLIYIMKL